MKKITGAAAIAFAAMLTLSLAACQGKTTYLDPVTGTPTAAPESTVESTVAESSADTAAAGTESTAESIAESTAESVAESSAEQAEESSAAESAPSASETAITFQKPDDWGTEIYAYVYAGEGDKVDNAAWPGVKMTDNGDGTFSYTLESTDIPSPLVIFNDSDSGSKKHQYPRTNGLKYVEGKAYTDSTTD